MTCLLIDDEPLALEVLQTYLRQFPDWQLLGAYSDPIAALAAISRQRPDLLFLDIEMPLFNGFEFLKALPYRPLVVLVTAYRHYAAESYEAEALDYLVKPVPLPRFARALHRATAALRPDAPPPAVVAPEVPAPALAPATELWLKVDRQLVRVVLADIQYVESLKDYVRVWTKNGKFVSHLTLQALAAQLPAADFLQVHKSYLVAWRAIESLDGNQLRLAGRTLPVGRSYRSGLLRRLQPGLPLPDDQPLP